VVLVALSLYQPSLIVFRYTADLHDAKLHQLHFPNISHILKISRYNYPATSSSSSAKEDLRITLDSIAYKCYPYRKITTSLDGYLFTKKWVQLEFGVQSNGGTS
jgi:hypothetical protein